MPEVTRNSKHRDSFASFGERRPMAFVDAGRHSARVRFFRRAIVVSCVSVASLLAFILLFDPLHRMDLGISLGRVNLEGSRISMDTPRLSGFRSDGQPYEIRAKTVVQDTVIPKVFELTRPEGRLGQKDGTTTTITAELGVYHSDTDLLDLNKNVRIVNPGRFEVMVETALVDMRVGKFSSDTLVAVVLPSGQVNAPGITYTDSEGVVAFSGGVHSSFNQTETRPDAPPSADNGPTEVSQ